MRNAPFVETARHRGGAGDRLSVGTVTKRAGPSYRPTSRGARTIPFGTAFALPRSKAMTIEICGERSDMTLKIKVYSDYV
jgi:hypothetical protein